MDGEEAETLAGHGPTSDQRNQDADPDSQLNDSDDSEIESDDDSVRVSDDDIIRNHPCYEQVMLDVNRCAGRLEHIRQCYLHRTDNDTEPPDDLSMKFKSFDQQRRDCDAGSGHDNTDEARGKSNFSRLQNDLACQRKLKRKLAKLIVKLLIDRPNLSYYQGFHDVCLTYMTIYGDEIASEKLGSLIDTHFAQFMQPTMNETQEFLAMIPIIIGLHDEKLRDFLELAEVGTIFALSWTITWFSHVISDQKNVENIFHTLGQHEDPHVILYLCAAIVKYRSKKILQLEPEMSIVHHYLCQLPRREKLPIDELLKEAENSFRKWPPQVVKDKLVAYRRARLQVENVNLIERLASRVLPSVGNLVAISNSRTALVVFVLASALAFSWDKLIK